jgi:hypothetical protein
MQTVVARFHHLKRDLEELESDLVSHGAEDAAITGYVVALTLDEPSHRDAAEAAKQLLDGIGATRIKITKRGRKHAAAGV